MKNLLKFAIGTMTELEKAVVWTGVGPSLGKAISCAEILKRKFNAHQISKICYNKVEDHCEPCTPEHKTLIEKRNVPIIHILISKQELDVNEPGYQGPGKGNTFLDSSNQGRPKSHKPRKARKKADLRKFTSNDGSGV